jgi:hypothetical protein
VGVRRGSSYLEEVRGHHDRRRASDGRVEVVPRLGVRLLGEESIDSGKLVVRVDPDGGAAQRSRLALRTRGIEAATELRLLLIVEATRGL